jgi:phage tail sheath gpL-like
VTIVIPGFTSDDKVPGVVAMNQYGAGRLSVGAIPLLCTLFGNLGSGGTGVANSRYEITTPEEADARFNARSELARMAHAALDIPGVTLRCVGVTPAAGGTAATFIVDIAGTWTASGELTIQLDEEVIRVAVAASHTPTTFGTALADATNQAQTGRLFCTAANVAGRVTFTVYSVGVRGNQHVAFLDTSLLPAGMTVTPDQLAPVTKSAGGPVMTVTGSDTVDATYIITISTGGTNSGTAQYTWTKNAVSQGAAAALPSGAWTLPGTTITVNSPAGTYILNETYTFTGVAALANGGIPFSLGAGTDDIDAALDATESVTNDYIGLAHNDATNVNLVEAAVNAKAAFDVGRLEQYVVCTHRGLTAAIAIGQTAMNDQLGDCLWVQNGVEHPSRLAARVAALRSITEGAQPNTNWDSIVIPGAAPQKRDADVANRSTLKSAINNGLTPLTTVNGELVIVIGICSRSLSGSTPDYRTFDWGDVSVPIRVRKELVVLGEEIKAQNPFSGPDTEEGLPPIGVFTPNLWKSAVNARLQDWESDRFNWLTEVAANPCEAEWESASKRVMSIVPTVVKPKFHQLGVVVRQQAAG